MAETAAVADKTTATAETTATTDKTTAASATTDKAQTTAQTTATTATTTDATTDKATKGYWPDDWLTRVSKGDEKTAKQLGRYASPEALAEAHISLRRRMDSGEFKPALPKDAKPEELKAWRKDNGIPDKPEGYDLKGIEVKEGDKEIINGFLTRAHAKHFSPEQAREAVAAYYDIEKNNVDARAAKDEEQRVATLDALNQEFGGQFRRNINLVDGLLSKFPKGVRESLKSARLPDGTALFNHPDAIKGFLALALEVNPAGIVVGADGGSLGKSMTDRYNEIQKYRREDRGGYNKDSKVQEEERSLIDAMMKHGLMDANGNLKDKKAA